jgi:hypothetical protein
LAGQTAPYHTNDAPAHLGLRRGGPTQPVTAVAGTGTPPECLTLQSSPLLGFLELPTTAALQLQSPPHATTPLPLAVAPIWLVIDIIALPTLGFVVAACTGSHRHRRINFIFLRFLGPSSHSVGLAASRQKASISICSSELVLSLGTLHLVLGPI